MDKGRDGRVTAASAVPTRVVLAVDKFLGGGFHLGLVTFDFSVMWKLKLTSVYERAKGCEEWHEVLLEMEKRLSAEGSKDWQAVWY